MGDGSNRPTQDGFGYDQLRAIYDTDHVLASTLAEIARLIGGDVGLAVHSVTASVTRDRPDVAGVVQDFFTTELFSPDRLSPPNVDREWSERIERNGAAMSQLGLDADRIFAMRDQIHNVMRTRLWNMLRENPTKLQRLLTAFESAIAWESLLLHAGLKASRLKADRARSAEYRSKLVAIDRSQLCVEFGLDGTILDANRNFLAATGYMLSEIKGAHHGMFCTEEVKASAEYAAFWQRLNQGGFEQGEFHRLAGDGTSLWLQATYNPILDSDDRPFKILKIADNVLCREAAARFGQQISARR